MKVNNFLIAFLIATTYLFSLFLYKQNPFEYKFDNTLVNKYYLSQDITYEPSGKRLFLSDDEIHIAAGYLYAKGADPTLLNFQHPPFIKYLFGYSTLLFNNPYIVQVAMSFSLLMITFQLGLRTFKKWEVGLVGAMLLAVDPLFISFSTRALLDLGQTVLLLSYVLLVLYFPKRIISQGLVLGLLFGSKFWAGSLFFLGLFTAYKLYSKQFIWKEYIKQIAIGAVVFSLTYFRTFINNSGLFNIVFFELKTLKYWFAHSVSSNFGSSVELFLLGNMRSWWGDGSMVREALWSPIWPLALVVSLTMSIKEVIKTKWKIKREFMIYLVPIAYLAYLSIQAPFVRYFIVILPFLYISLSQAAFLILQKIIKRT